MEAISFNTVCMPVRHCLIGYLQWSRFLSKQYVRLSGVVRSATFNGANSFQDSLYTCQVLYDRLQWSRFLSTQSVCLLGIVSSATFNEANCSQDSQYACQALYDWLPSMEAIPFNTVCMPVRHCLIGYLQWSRFPPKQYVRLSGIV